MTHIFLNTPENCQWLKSTHLKNRPELEFKSFVLYGNEDAPEKVELYFSNDPFYTDGFHTVTF